MNGISGIALNSAFGMSQVQFQLGHDFHSDARLQRLSFLISVMRSFYK